MSGRQNERSGEIWAVRGDSDHTTFGCVQGTLPVAPRARLTASEADASPGRSQTYEMVSERVVASRSATSTQFTMFHRALT
jgi:hypothetical protein